MSAIIKAGSHAALFAVRPIAGQGPVALVPVVDEERERLRTRVSELEREALDRDNATKDLHAEIDQALDRGREEGRAQGRIEAEDRQAERLAALEEGIRTARDDLSAKLAAMENLAALLARDCLDIVLGGAGQRQSLVEDIMKTQMARLDRDMVLTVEVAAQDFPDEIQRAAFAERLGLAPGMLMTADKPSGHCAMRLKLGSVDAGVDRQWGELRAVLEDAIRRVGAS